MRANRREFLLTLGAAASPLATRIVFAATGGAARLVVVILRGALDGLAAVPPYGDPHYASLRRELAIASPGVADGALRLDATFGLHPRLSFLHESFAAGQLIVFHAVATPYRERSHFDGQDVLENGTVRPHALASGWMNRALDALPRSAIASHRQLGVALGQNVPLLMRGPASVASWSPSRLAPLDEDTLQRLGDLYAGDPVLSRRLADALAADSVATEGMRATTTAPAVSGDPPPGAGSANTARTAGAARFNEIVAAAAGFLRDDAGPRVAVFDTTGWDTHANEGGAQGQLGARLGVLDEALRTLKDRLGPAWRNTAVLAATEFGRTAAVNGTRGTDHGTATAAFLLGGAVRGGRVIADWPGLSQRALYQQRDLAPTMDLRAVLKGLLRDHLGISARALSDTVFPQSASVRPLADLTRA